MKWNWFQTVNFGGVEVFAAVPIVMGVLFCVGCVVCFRARKETGASKWSCGALGVLGVALLAACGVGLWRPHTFMTGSDREAALKIAADQDQNRQAAAYVTAFFRENKDVQLNGIGDGFPHGPKDVKPGWGNDVKEDTLRPEQIDMACRLIEALADNDLDRFTALIHQQEGQPFSRAQIAHSMEYCMHLLDIPIRFFAHERWFYIETPGLEDGALFIVFSAKGAGEGKPAEGPEVMLQLESKENPGQYHTERSDRGRPSEVFAHYRNQLVGYALKKQSAEKVSKRGFNP